MILNYYFINMSTILAFLYQYSIDKIYLYYFFFQAEDGIRDAQESRGLGDVYKRQDN